MVLDRTTTDNDRWPQRQQQQPEPHYHRMTRLMAPRASTSTDRTAVRLAMLLLLLLATTLATVVTGDVGGGGGAVDTGPPRTVMELMEVMLNRDLLAMLRDGGFDFRPPSRLFLPPKFYSHVPLDHGHMTPEEIFGIPEEKSSPVAASVVNGGKTQHQKGTPAAAAAAGAPASTASSPVAPRINLISYSDSKVTFSVDGKPVPGSRGGAGATPANKGSATLEQNVGTNVKSLQPPVGLHRTSGARTPNDLPLTTSITDQTVGVVSPTGTGGGAAARTLPASARSTGGQTERRSGGSGATATERLRAALPGEPDVDYPILGSIPSTAFSCENRPHGYYADVETRCQVFRVCANTDSSGRGFAFLCPNGTLFNQRFLVCDWYTNVRCEASPDFYHLNQDIGRMSGRPMVSPDRDVMMEAVRSMMTYPMRSLMRMMQGGGDSSVPSSVFGGLPDTGRTLATVKVGSSGGSYSVPSLGLEAPFQQQQQQPPSRPVSSGLQDRTTISASQDSSYRPPLNQVYVSSLGTLSTESNSGFDPVRSTVLTPSAPARLSPPQPSLNRFTFPNQPSTNGVKVSELQIVPAGLVKYWDGREPATAARQPPTLKLKPVTQQTFTGGPELVITPRPARPILPPTGVLPPSTFLRTLAPQQQPQYRQQPASSNLLNVPSAQHRFTPVQKVVGIQKVTVLPETRPQSLSSVVAPFTSPQDDFSYQAASDQRQILRRIDVAPRIPSSPSGYRLEGRKPGLADLQVVPALSYYLNDPLEQQAFDEAVQHGLLDERRHESYRRWAAQPSYARSSSSYDVPQGSVGQLVTRRHHP